MTIEVRTGQIDVALTKEEFLKRFTERYRDPAFDVPESVLEAAWDSYHRYRKWPNTRPAGPGFQDPEFPLAHEWLAARKAIAEAQTRHDDPQGPLRILIINASDRNDKTCPGEMSKTHRLARSAQQALASEGVTTQVLDLSRLTSEYGRIIYPCKGCVSTAMPLCHWPCSCYPNFAMGQVNDWMNEIYPMWVEAHGILVVTPVYWHSPPGGLKVMMDRLVCADGGNPDPTSTNGKDPAKAKAVEQAGWDYPRHLAGRNFAIAVHGDSAGVETVRRILTDWLTDMHLVEATGASMDRYIGYYEGYATSHEALDRDDAIFAEVAHAAHMLAAAARGTRENGPKLWSEPRPK